MPKTISAEGKTSTEAIEKGLKELKATRSQVDVKILEEKKKSFGYSVGHYDSAFPDDCDYLNLYGIIAL